MTELFFALGYTLYCNATVNSANGHTAYGGTAETRRWLCLNLKHLQAFGLWNHRHSRASSHMLFHLHSSREVYKVGGKPAEVERDEPTISVSSPFRLGSGLLLESPSVSRRPRSLLLICRSLSSRVTTHHGNGRNGGYATIRVLSLDILDIREPYSTSRYRCTPKSPHGSPGHHHPQNTSASIPKAIQLLGHSGSQAHTY